MGQFNPLQRYFILLLSSLAIVATCAQDRSEVGEFSEPVPFGIVPVAVANLPDGRLLTWSSQFRNTFMEIGDGMTFTEIYDPFMGPDGTALGEFTSNTDHDMFCPGINNLADGRILSAGGTTSERTSIYDPKTGVWSVAQDMNIPRGYQGNVTLSNGAVFTVGGSWSGGAGNNGGKDAEIWSPLTGWVELPNITGEDIYTSNDLFLEKQGEYRVDNHIWLWPASNGKLFHAGPSERMHWIDTEAPGGEIVDAGPRGGDTYSMKGTTVMFDVDKILKVGGAESYGADFSSNTPAKDNSYVIDLNGTGYGEFPNVTFAGNLAFNRTMHNSTVLPDGTVLVTGGLDRGAVFTDQGSRLEAELFDPTNNSWTTMALMHEARTYHSVAILMTDGRVFVGGGGLCNNLLNGCENHFNAEIYSPPYLFNSDNSLAERPVITNINTGNAAGYYEEAVVDYGDVIEVTTDSDVTEFSLIRFSAATHSTNNEQRRIPLTGSGSRTHQLTIPNRNLLPPGYYMLFALDANGVPSVAKTIKIGSALPLDVPNTNLVLDLDFEEGSGTAVADASQYANDADIRQFSDTGAAVPVNANNFTADGLFGGALQMDGLEFRSNTIVDVPYSPSLATVGEQITVSAWVWRDDVVTQAGKVPNVGVLSQDYPALFAGFHNTLYKWAFQTDQGIVDLYAGFAPLDGWVHIAATYDGEVARLYGNGVEIARKEITGTIRLGDNANPLNGAFTVSGFYDNYRPLPAAPYGNTSGVTDEIDGKMDRLKVYNVALGAEEISAMFQEGQQQGDPTVADCPAGTIVAEYRIGTGGTWITGNSISVPEGSQVFIRAKNYGGEYFITTHQVDGPTFSTVADAGDLTADGAYQIDTNERPSSAPGHNDGLVGPANTGQYVLTTPGGCPATIDLQVMIDNTTDGCPNFLRNENEALVLGEGRLSGNLDVAVGTPFNTNGSPCALEVSNVDPNQAFARYEVSLNLNQLGILPGHELYISLDADATNGRGRLEVSRDNVTNSSILDHTFTGGWSTFEGTVTVPSGITTLDLWFFSNYNQQTAGTVYYDNLTVVNLTTTGGNLPPRALISATPMNGEAPLDVSFIGSTSTDDTAVTQYSWDFGDGQESTLADPEHTYANEGSYTAILTVTDAGGLTDTESILIEVGPSSFECASLNLQAQYSINGEAAVAGQTTVTLTVGDEISLGLLPEGTSFTVSGHVSKTELDENPLNIESIRLEDAGLYRFTTTEGCTLDFELIVEEFDCSTLGLMAQYSINGATAVTGDNSAEINVGDDLRFGLLPEGTIYSISGPQNKPLDANSFLLESAVTEDAGTYILSSSDGCTVEFTLVVNTVECSALNLQVSYSVNGETAVTGANSVTLTEGDDISLFLLPQGSQFSVSGKNSKPLDANALLLEDVEMEDAGPHTFTNEDGCNVTFDILVEPLPLDCSNITAQYSINGATAVTGENSATLSPGDDLRIGLLPEGTLYSISGPRNKPMNANILLLENVETGDAGMYTMTTDTGCKVEFSVVVNNVECNAQNLEMLYSINGAVAVSGASSVTLTEGDAINLSLLPEGTLFSVGGPNSKPMNANALLLDDVAVGDAGFYTFTTQNGCSLPFEILVEPISEECENIMARYSINGATAVTGENAVTLSQGDALTLSLLPEGTLYSINGPNNKPLDTNALLLENVMADDGGTYTLTAEEGCTIPFEVTVIPPTDCPEGNVVVRYTVNGVTTSGENTLALNEGDQVLLDVLPFGLEFTITLPDGQVLTDAFETMAILPEQEGTYLFSAENYCSSTLAVTVTPDPSVSEPTLEDLIIFPNPVTSGTLNVVLEDFMNEAIFIGFHDMYGKLVQQEVIAQDHGATVALDVSKWSSGTYIVIIKRENSSETVFKKVLKFQ